MLSAVKRIKETIENAEVYDQSQFYKSQWQKSPFLVGSYILYRWIIACIFLVVLIAAITDMGTSVEECLKFCIYLTYWGFILCTVQVVLGAIVVTRKYRELKILRSDAEKMASLKKASTLVEIYSIIYTMSVVSASGITIIFWTRVYIPDYYEWGIMIFLLHGLNTFLMFLDLILVAHPLKFVHFLWTLGFIFVYLCFSYLYHLAGGTNAKNHPFVYHSLNWENPGNALRFCVSSLLYGFIIHICVWLFSVVIRRVSGAARPVNNPSNPAKFTPVFHNSRNYSVKIVPVTKR